MCEGSLGDNARKKKNRPLISNIYESLEKPGGSRQNNEAF